MANKEKIKLKEDIKPTIEELKKSPVYSMSLGSKELYHSNFWAWLIEQDNSYAQIFDKNINNSNLDVAREEKGRDITIKNDNNEWYVIENKLKSIATIDQLIKYQNDVGKKFKGGVLTGIKKPDFDMPDGWSFLSFKDIIDGIKKINDETKTSLTQNIINQYIKDVCNIIKIVEFFEKDTGDNFPKNTNAENSYIPLLKDKGIRLWDLCQKHKASEFVEYLRNESKFKPLEEGCKKYGFELKFESGFSHSTASIDAKFVRDKGKNKEISIGIQIQNGQYRKFAVRRGHTNTEKVYEEFKVYEWFEEYDKSSKKIFNQNTCMKKDFCQFAPKKDKYYFVNQHYKIKDYSFEKLTNNIHQDLARALEIIENNKL